MAILSARPIEPTDIEGVTLRQLDFEECEAAGLTPEEAIELSYENSAVAWTVFLDDEPAAYWGYNYTSIVGTTCYLWLLTTPLCDKHKVRFARHTQRQIRELLKMWPNLICSVDIRHVDSRKWLEWLGFRESGVNNEYSVPFIIMKKAR